MNWSGYSGCFGLGLLLFLISAFLQLTIKIVWIASQLSMYSCWRSQPHIFFFFAVPFEKNNITLKVLNVILRSRQIIRTAYQTYCFSAKLADYPEEGRFWITVFGSNNTLFVGQDLVYYIHYNTKAKKALLLHDSVLCVPYEVTKLLQTVLSFQVSQNSGFLAPGKDSK